MNGGSQADFSRRQFVRGAGALLGAGTGALDAAASSPQPASAPAQFDFTRSSAALQPDRVVSSACQFCNSACGLNVQLKHGRVLEILGEHRDPVQAGALCVKAPMMTQLVYNEHRLTTPLVRVGGAKGSAESRFEPATWPQALDVIARKFLDLRDAGQAHTIANRTSGRLPRGTGSLVGRFFELLGSPNDTDVGPVCNDAGGNALAWTFGLGNFTNGYGVDEATGAEDLGAARMFLFLGTNQAETHPVTFAHLLRCRERTGAKLVVVDPRKTPTSDHADAWIAIRPHTDLALALAMCRHIIDRGLFDREFVTRWVVGFEEFAAHLADNGYSPEWAARVCDVPADSIRRLAEEFAAAKPAAIFCNAGISHQMHAFDTYRALAFLCAVTGNIGVPGGGCNFMHNTWPGDLRLPPLSVETPPRREALPVGPDWFAESILHGRPYPLRAVVTEGNPLLSSANTAKVREAFARLEFYVYTGLFMEESAYFADVVLPVCSGLEMETVYMRRDDRAIRWQRQAVPRVGLSKPDWEIWIELAAAMQRHDRRSPAEYWTSQLPAEWADYSTLWSLFVKHTPGMGGMTAERMQARPSPLRWPCPDATHPGVSTLYLDHPSWYAAVRSLFPGEKTPRRFLTPSGRVELTTPAMDEALRRVGHTALPTFHTHPDLRGGLPILEHSEELVSNPVNPRALTPIATQGTSPPRAADDPFPLLGVIGRPSVVHFAGVTQWTYLGKQLNGERLIQIHPAAARRRGIAAGDAVLVSSARGRITGTALLWDGIREDTVFVPNTFGPAQVFGDRFGVPRYAAANELTDDRHFDNLSGQQAYKCFACDVRRA